MAYARFGRDSDVYVYADTAGGYTCERCPEVGQAFHCPSAAEMVPLVLAHLAKGLLVPTMRSKGSNARWTEPTPAVVAATIAPCYSPPMRFRAPVLALLSAVVILGCGEAALNGSGPKRPKNKGAKAAPPNPFPTRATLDKVARTPMQPQAARNIASAAD